MCSGHETCGSDDQFLTKHLVWLFHNPPLLLNTVISVPKDIKLNINELVDKSGITEFDHIIKLNQDLTINVNNPYFRYIKQIKTNEKNSPVEYGELVLKKIIYIYFRI